MNKVIIQELEAYITASNAHTNPKTLKVLEVASSDEKIGLRAVTLPTTFMIEWIGKYSLTDQGNLDRRKALEELQLTHVLGKVTDTTTGRT